MPELPDLVYLEKKLNEYVLDQTIAEVEVIEPVVIRVLIDEDFTAALKGQKIAAIRRHGPFLVFQMADEMELIIHPMLAGRFQWLERSEKAGPAPALGLHCDPAGRSLYYLDNKKMGKVYLILEGDYSKIPRFLSQGPDLLGEDFSLPYFKGKAQKSRKQVRVMIMDQTMVSAIGNAYADEILFCAGIHPKTFCTQLDEGKIEKLYHCIKEVMQWGIAAVANAGQPIEKKIRDHLNVRNRANEPCPRCSAKIRKAGVLGYDAFFCPECQPLTRSQFIDWRKLKS